MLKSIRPPFSKNLKLGSQDQVGPLKRGKHRRRDPLMIEVPSPPPFRVVTSKDARLSPLPPDMTASGHMILTRPPIEMKTYTANTNIDSSQGK